MATFEYQIHVKQMANHKEKLSRHIRLNVAYKYLMIEEQVSATKTELSDRKLSSLIALQQSIIVSDITHLGRNKAME